MTNGLGYCKTIYSLHTAMAKWLVLDIFIKKILDTGMAKWLCTLSWQNGTVHWHGKMGLNTVMAKWYCTLSWQKGTEYSHYKNGSAHSHGKIVLNTVITKWSWTLSRQNSSGNCHSKIAVNYIIENGLRLIHYYSKLDNYTKS